MSQIGPASWPMLLSVLLFAGLVGLSASALRRGARREAAWMAASAAAMLAAGIVGWSVYGRLASPWAPGAYAEVFGYVALYCWLRGERLHFGAPAAFKLSMALLAISIPANIAALTDLWLSSRPSIPLMLMYPIPLLTAWVVAFIEMGREEAAAKKRDG